MKYYKFCLLKAYFEKGYGLTNYIKYLIALFGLSSLNVKSTLIMALFYAVGCFILGYYWFRFGVIEAEIEVGNQFNHFVKEMRKKVN